MEINGFRASYGDSKGAHDLIKTASEIESEASRLRTFTDKAPNSPPNLVWEPFFRGFAFEDYYVLIKIFPDFTASRSGMVYSEALFYPLNKATKISNLDLLLSAFSLTLEEGKENQSSDYKVPLKEDESYEASDEPPGLVALCNNLVDNETNNSVVWIGQQGFVKNISALWSRMSPLLRQSLSFRFCFVPQDFGSKHPDIIYTPSQLAGRWIEYRRIFPTNVEAPKNKVVAFLLGRKEGELVRKFLFDLSIEPADWKVLRLCEQCVDYQSKLDQGEITASEFRGFMNRISLLAPNENQGGEYKKGVFRQFCENLKNGSFEDLFAINNLDLEAFPEADQQLNVVTKDWLKKNLLGFSPVEAAKILLRAKEFNKQSWGRSVLDSLVSVTENWNKKTAGILWRWWQNDDRLFELLKNYFPQLEETSEILSETCPENLPERLGEKISDYAESEKLWGLYASVITAYLSPLEAVKRQLKTEPLKVNDKNSGLPVLFDRLRDDDILSAALKIEDDRLLPYLAQRIVTKKQLLVRIDLKNTVWQKLTRLMLEKAADKFWLNVTNQKEIIFQILDIKLNGELAEQKLIPLAAQSGFANLLDYSKRTSIWTQLQGNPLEQFLSTTADAWWQLFSENRQFEKISKPEQPLRSYVLNGDKAKRALKNASNPFDFLFRIFRFFEELDRYDFENLLSFTLIQEKHVNQVMAIELGKFIQERGWRNCAEVLKSQIERDARVDLLPALEQCANLFGWIESYLSPTLSRLKKTRLHWEDWWNAFTECLIDLYKDGPMQKHLWERAGGDSSVLLKHTTGRNSWQDAIQTLRNGGGGKKLSTISIMMEVKEDYHNNEKIEVLERLFYELGGKY